MSLKDFQGIHKYKAMILIIVIVWISFNVLCPIFYGEIFEQVFIFLSGAYILKLIYYIFMMARASIHARKILSKVKSGSMFFLPAEKNIYHSVVIPIYDEGIELLTVTLSKLAEHSRAKKQYLIFLALQYLSDGSAEQMGKKLQLAFQDKFKLISFTIHHLQQGEAKGKASNENWCVTRMEPILLKNNIDPSQVMFTTVDADTWAPEAYFSQIELFISQHQWKMDRYMFAPNQMFTINNLQVPIMVRAMDYLLGLSIYCISNNVSQTQTAASNYSISFNSLREIGFFDTNADAMCDDFHTSYKAIWKKNGNFKIVPIFIMFNLTCLQTERGYLQNLKARFWQAERHMRGFLQVSYNLNMLFKSPFQIRTFLMTFFGIEQQLLTLFSQFIGMSFIFYKQISGIPYSTVEWTLIVSEAILSSSLGLLYFFVIRQSSSTLYQIKKVSIALWIEVMLVFKLVLTCYMILPQIIAVFRTLSNPTYDSTPKPKKIVSIGQERKPAE